MLNWLKLEIQEKGELEEPGGTEENRRTGVNDQRVGKQGGIKGTMRTILQGKQGETVKTQRTRRCMNRNQESTQTNGT